ncbi:MAG: hypothetical protein ACRCZ2_14110 [Fusobacteriaceae bacterium]
MAIMKVRKVGSVGVVKDLPSFELPPEAWSNSRNVRFAENRIEKMGGYFPVLMDGMPEEPPLAILTRNNTQDQIYATKDSIYMINGRTHRNISQLIKNPDYVPPPETDEDVETYPDPQPEFIPKKYQADPENTWYYTTLSNSVVLNNPRDTPQGLRPGDDTFVELPGWGKPNKDKPETTVLWQAGRIRSFKNYLVALDMTEGSQSNPQRVRWSNVAYVNALPPDWIEDDEARDGGFNDLTDANGRILDGVPLRDSFVIYTDQETYLMEYVGGVMIFNFKKLFSDSGVLAPECAVEFEQQHFVISKDDIFVHNGSSKKPVASGRVKQYLIDEISSVNPFATKVFAYTPRKEIWITYVGPGQTLGDPRDPSAPTDPDIQWQCNKCAIWNWEWDTWYFYDIPKSYDINMCPPPDLTSKEWDDYYVIPDDEWDDISKSQEQWSELGKDFVKKVPYIASPDRALYTLDIGKEQITWDDRFRGENSVPLIAELLRTHLDMDEVVENTRSYKFIRRIVPQIRGFGELHCSVGGSFNSTQEPDWDNYQIFDIEEEDKIDAYSNNRYPAIKFMDHTDGEWSFIGYDIDFIVEGNR